MTGTVNSKGESTIGFDRAGDGPPSAAGKTVAEKLLIKPGSTVWASELSELGRIQPFPDGVQLAERAADATTALVFARDAASLRSLLEQHGEELHQPAVVWIAYPKTNRVDLSRDTVWPIVVELQMRPIGQASIDDDWSAMRFRPLADGEAPFTGGR